MELGIQASVEAICAHLTDALIAHGMPYPELVLEPGRSIAGPAGTTLYRVGSIKRAADGTVYAAVDGGMSDNPRPALYGARYTRHRLRPAGRRAGERSTRSRASTASPATS